MLSPRHKAILDGFIPDKTELARGPGMFLNDDVLNNTRKSRQVMNATSPETEISIREIAMMDSQF